MADELELRIVALAEGIGGDVKDRPTSVTTGEPTGADPVTNIVSLTQAEYDAGTPVAGTFYLITG